LAPARTRLARKQNAGLWFDRLTILSEVEGLVGSPSFAEAASRSRRRAKAALATARRSQPKMEDNLFTSPKRNKNAFGKSGALLSF